MTEENCEARVGVERPVTRGILVAARAACAKVRTDTRDAMVLYVLFLYVVGAN